MTGLKPPQIGRGGAQLREANLFAACRVDRWPEAGDYERKGDAKRAVDREIGRMVVHLAGAVPAANSLRLPRRREGSLDAAGRFLYIQLRLKPGQAFAIHADLVAADRGLHRLTLSNMHGGQEAARMKRSGVQVCLPATHDRWTLLALDLAALGRRAGRSPHSRLRALQLCAGMTVRGAFTSDAKHDWQSLPEDLRFTAAFDASTQAEVVWVPEEPREEDVRVAAPRRRPTSPHPPLPAPAARQPKEPAARPAAGGTCPAQLPPELLPSPAAEPLWVSAFCGRRPGLLHWVPACATGSGSGGDGKAAAGAEDEVVFAGGALIVGMQAVEGGRQRYLRGHSAPVCALAVSADGGRLASAEEGPGAEVRLWDFRRGCCLATVPGHAGGTACLDLSPDGGLLASVGVDSQGRQELVLWDLSRCWAAAAGAEAGSSAGACGGGRPLELARRPSEHNIQAVRVVPWGPPGRVATCGKNSVRVWSLREGQLRGVSVPMGGLAPPAVRRRPYSCGTLAAPSSGVGDIFTCLAFEQPPAGVPPGAVAPRLLAGTLSGAVYTIDVEAHAVEAVAQLHDGAVAALAPHAGLCATGAADGLLRVWSSDLQEVMVEARHEAPVTGVALAPGGLLLAAGTESGALSLLDLARRQYRTLLRSHTAPVRALALMPQEGGRQQQGMRYVTGSADGTVRVWEAGGDRQGGHQQLLELTAQGETVLSLACHPGTAEVACGFQSGALRVFDAASAGLVHESRQHSGAVKQLAFARHGRLLFSLGEDGCVCAYDPQRAYAPTSYLLAGFPLHATAIAASRDGRLLATAALSMSDAGCPRSGRSGGAKAAPPSLAQPLLMLHDTVSMQPTLQVPVAGSSPVVALHLLPDSRLVLAGTTDRRLRAYSCADGACILDVPRCLPQPCLATALDPAGALLLAGGPGGALKLLSLHPLHAALASGKQGDGTAAASAAAPTASPASVSLASLLCQELAAPTGGALRAAAFLPGGRELLTVGDCGAVCCWAIHAQSGSGCMAAEPAEAEAAIATLVLRQTQGAGTSTEEPHGLVEPPAGAALPRPVLRVAADCLAAAPAAPRASAAAADISSDAAELQPELPRSRAVPQPCACSTTAHPHFERAAPRSQPEALQQPVRPRPPSAPPGLSRAAQLAPASTNRQQGPSASLPATPARGRAPLWERQAQPNEGSLLITAAADGQRCAQVVRQERRLLVSSPCKEGGPQQRTAQWAECEVAADHVPPHVPSHQLQLLPPTAAVARVQGFTASAGFGWLAAEGGGEATGQQQHQQHQQQQRSLVFAAGNVVVREAIEAAEPQQRHVARLPSAITALAVSPDGQLAAAAVEPSGGSAADLHLLSLASAEPLGVLSHHSFAVGALHFSPDGAWLVSLGATGMALWSVGGLGGGASELVAGLQLPEAPAGLAWCAGSAVPTFYTVGSKGLVQWRLEPEALASTAVHLPAALRRVPLTAVACMDDEGEEEERWRPAERQGGRVLVGDGGGRVWLLQVDDGQDVRSSWLLAEAQGRAVSCLQARGPLVAAGTADGALLLLAAEGGRQQDDAWRLLGCHQLDSAVVGAQLEAGARAATATTASGTLWRVEAGGSPRVLLCGQAQGMRSWSLAQGGAWKGLPATAAVASAAGVAVWQLEGCDGKGGTPARAPLVEFGIPEDVTHTAMADDASCCAAAYADGSICLFDVAGACLRWRVEGAAQQGGVAALTVVQRLRGCKVMVAYRSGALYVLSGASGQVAHRSMQFAVQQDSGRQSRANFPVHGLTVCPTDSSVFALSGQHGLVVCRAHWMKAAALHPLARLSFGAADATGPPAAAAGGEEEAPGQQRAAVVAQVTFSRAHPEHLYCTDPSAPGQLLLLDFASQATIKTLFAPLAAGAAITALALDPKESLLAAGTSGGTVLLLRLATEAWSELTAHSSAVTGLAFTAGGIRLISAAGTATFVWDVEQ